MTCNSNYIHETEDGRKLVLPCGKCLGCSITRQRGWILRLTLEQMATRHSSFVTLTYDDDNLPPALMYEHVQGYLKRCRKNSGQRIRFFCCGEYGPRTKRPHWHLIMLGYIPPVLETDRFIKPHLRSSKQGSWPYGFSVIGTVTKKSIGYVTRYSLKKAQEEEEIIRCSQGLGKQYFEDLASVLTTRTLEKSFTNESGPHTILLPWHLKVGKSIYPISRSCRQWMKRKVTSLGHIPKDMSEKSVYENRTEKILNLFNPGVDNSGYARLMHQWMQGKSVLTSYDDYVLSEHKRSKLGSSASGTL